MGVFFAKVGVFFAQMGVFFARELRDYLLSLGYLPSVGYLLSVSFFSSYEVTNRNLKAPMPAV